MRRPSNTLNCEDCGSRKTCVKLRKNHNSDTRSPRCRRCHNSELAYWSPDEFAFGLNYSQWVDQEIERLMDKD